ncbi:macro domain-containing protein [Elusimicrobiota bacterium]
MIIRKVNGKMFSLVMGDISDMEVDAFVFYAQHDLRLGSGYGTAITQRGGPGIKKELEKIGRMATGKAVTTGAGELKAKHIIHAVGPRFQEEDEERKLRDTMKAALTQSEGKGIKSLAFPPMGTGFYGIPLDLCKKVMVEEIRAYLQGKTDLKEIRIVVMDLRESVPFEEAFKSL